MNETKKLDCDICEQISQGTAISQPPRLTSASKFVLGFGVAIASIIYGVAIPFVLPGFRKVCLPYIPATDKQIQNILICLKGRSGALVDLGSGDGRIILSVMKANGSNNYFNIEKADGVELNPWLVLYSKYSKWRHRRSITSGSVSFYKKDIFKTDLGIYDNIVVFGVEGLMTELECKLEHDLKSNGVLIACRFPLPNWVPVLIEGEGIDRVWVYDRTSMITDTIV